MKRADNRWEKVVSDENIIMASRCAIKGRKKMASVMKFQQNRNELLLKLQESLINGTYRTSQYRFFLTSRRTQDKAIGRVAILP